MFDVTLTQNDYEEALLHITTENPYTLVSEDEKMTYSSYPIKIKFSYFITGIEERLELFSQTT